MIFSLSVSTRRSCHASAFSVSGFFSGRLCTPNVCRFFQCADFQLLFPVILLFLPMGFPACPVMLSGRLFQPFSGVIPAGCIQVKGFFV
ncbi:MAG: hypothetical protein DRH32_02785 [Deltaproteobacteria bacterium]|nr:MAG: hypothetical protein DRH32_02785 [Deltaproteobacteria bacterium]